MGKASKKNQRKRHKWIVLVNGDLSLMRAPLVLVGPDGEEAAKRAPDEVLAASERARVKLRATGTSTQTLSLLEKWIVKPLLPLPKSRDLTRWIIVMEMDLYLNWRVPQVAAEPDRAAELVREKVVQNLADELPGDVGDLAMKYRWKYKADKFSVVLP